VDGMEKRERRRKDSKIDDWLLRRTDATWRTHSDLKTCASFSLFTQDALPDFTDAHIRFSCLISHLHSYFEDNHCRAIRHRVC
jgi:hypothetical protein